MFLGLPNALWTWEFRSVTARTGFINTWWPDVPFDSVGRNGVRAICFACLQNMGLPVENNVNCKVTLFWEAALRLVCRNVNVS